MNAKCFRLVFNERTRLLVPAPEIVRANHGDGSNLSSAGVPNSRLRRLLRAQLVPLAAACICLFGQVSFANPVGLQVVNGSASISSTAKQVTVTNSPNAILNWNSFSIAAGEATRFNQVNAASAVLNRVTGTDPSALLGTLSSNGKVFLINPNGVVFGAGSRIDTQGFLASTLNISDRDFLEGRMRFAGTGGAIDNQGSLFGGSGDVILIAPNINNSGTISSQGGNVILAAGQKVEIANPGISGIRFEVQAPTDKVVNLGSLSGGAVGVFAGTLSQAGQIQATTLSMEGGKVLLKAGADVRLEAGSRTAATGAHGGEVQVLGQNITLVGGSGVDASGTQGGGSILVGVTYMVAIQTLPMPVVRDSKPERP